MQVLLTYDAWHKMRCYVNASYPEDEENRSVVTLREISGVGLVKQTDSGDLFVYDVMLMPHEASSARVDLTTKEAMDGWAEVVMDIATTRPEVMPDLAVWWHSHPFGKGTPHFSSIDTGTMEKWQLPDGYLLSIVTNEHGELSIRYDQWTPTRQRLELPYQVLLPELEQEGRHEIGVLDVRDEVKAKVTYPKPTPIVPYSQRQSTGWETGGGQGVWAGDFGFGYRPAASRGRDHDGDWEVWRVDCPVPYRVASFRKRKKAQADADDLAQKVGKQYVVQHKKDPAPASVEETVSARKSNSWAVFRDGHSEPVATAPTEELAESEKEKLQGYAEQTGSGFTYRVVQMLNPVA